MTHREDKKQTKRGNNKSASPEIIHEDEIKKNPTKGAIKGTE